MRKRWTAVFPILLFLCLLLGGCRDTEDPAPADTLSPSEDPVAFIAQHKGGASPNYYYEEPKTRNYEEFVGPDGDEFYGEYYGGLFPITAERVPRQRHPLFYCVHNTAGT